MTVDLEITNHTLRLAGSDRAALASLVAESGLTENMAIQTAIQNAASMNTDARRKASAAYHAKRKASGLQKVTLWLSPEARDALDALKTEHGSKDAVADTAIRRLAAGEAKAATPVSADPG